MIPRYQLVECARSLIGTPWEHQGRLPGVAIDCLGVIGEVASACRVECWEAWDEDPDLRCYGRSPRPDLLLKFCNKYLEPKPISKAGPGDIFLMTFYLIPHHFGIVTEVSPFRIVHAYTAAKRVVETTPQVAHAKVYRAYSFRGVEPWLP